ncbi:hypothetical protein LTR37_002743 [Vermiconidia calcicola]|uniref:Uncharacterized protein n=1 Tax=Vermiconidia calcicola TaxID=1690605 RepID=A0ACC3NRM6_9PEZI|nr:hypothetical protein LTR37_002743 [Vermiconidia calcicola]
MARAYYPLSLEDVEDIENYRPGGFHPVHLRDIYEGRYKVLHKLGAGGYTTTWLAHDTSETRYVALKIVKASATASCAELQTLQRLADIETDHPGRVHIRNLLAYFTVIGPNGKHYCLVTEVAGPTLLSLYDAAASGYARRLRAKTARSIARQVTQALGFLHSMQVGHGGKAFSPELVVPDRTQYPAQAEGEDSWTEEDIYERFGTPRKEILLTASKSSPGDFAPRYIVEAAKVPEERFLTEEIFLIDSGVSFPFEAPPRPQDIGVPFMYRPPETFFDSKYDQSSDLWSLGCLLFEIRAGIPLFSRFMGTEDKIVRQWVQMKGKLPDAWWSSWKARSLFFDESGKPLSEGPNGQAMANVYPLDEMTLDIGDEDGDEDSEDRSTNERESRASMLELPGTKLAEDEARDVGDLLTKILRWNPEERIPVEQILQHRWIST